MQTKFEEDVTEITDPLKELANLCKQDYITPSLTSVTDRANDDEMLQIYKNVQRQQTQRWNDDEHYRFLSGVDLFGRDKPTLISQHVATKSVRQVISHSQKYFQRLDRLLQASLMQGYQTPQNRVPIVIEDIKPFLRQKYGVPDFESVAFNSSVEKSLTVQNNTLYLSHDFIYTLVPEPFRIKGALQTIYPQSNSSLSLSLKYLEEKLGLSAGAIAVVALAQFYDVGTQIIRFIHTTRSGVKTLLFLTLSHFRSKTNIGIRQVLELPGLQIGQCRSTVSRTLSVPLIHRHETSEQPKINPKLVCIQNNYSPIADAFRKRGYEISTDINRKDFKYLFVADGAILSHDYQPSQRCCHLKHNARACKKSLLTRALAEAYGVYGCLPQSYEIRTLQTDGDVHVDQTEDFLKEFAAFECAKIVQKYINKPKKAAKPLFIQALQHLRFIVQFETVVEFPIKINAFPLPPQAVRELIDLPQQFPSPNYKFQGLTDAVREEINQDVYKDVVQGLKKAKLLEEAKTVLDCFVGNNRQALGTKNAWVCKPVGKSRGRGIFCADALRTIMTQKVKFEAGLEETKIDQTDCYLVQKYVEKPALYKGRKFDLRCWVLVSSAEPLAAHLWTEPYARLATNEYSADFSDFYAHLTNNSIQKTSEDYDGNMASFADVVQEMKIQRAKKECDPIKADQKLAVSADDAEEDQEEDAPIVVQQPPTVVKQPHPDLGELLIRQFCQIARDVLLATQKDIKSDQDAFELLGFDFLIDDFCKVWLLEVNSTPTLERATPLVSALIDRMCAEWIDILEGGQGRVFRAFLEEPWVDREE